MESLDGSEPVWVDTVGWEDKGTDNIATFQVRKQTSRTLTDTPIV